MSFLLSVPWHAASDSEANLNPPLASGHINWLATLPLSHQTCSYFQDAIHLLPGVPMAYAVAHMPIESSLWTVTLWDCALGLVCQPPFFDEHRLEQMLLEQKWFTFPACLCLSPLDTASVGHSFSLSPFHALRCTGGGSLLGNRLTSLYRLPVSHLTEAYKAGMVGSLL